MSFRARHPHARVRRLPHAPAYSLLKTELAAAEERERVANIDLDVALRMTRHALFVIDGLLKVSNLSGDVREGHQIQANELRKAFEEAVAGVERRRAVESDAKAAALPPPKAA